VSGAGPPPAAYTDRDLVIAIPALGRAHLIEGVYRSALKATPGARVVFACTEGDVEVLAEVERVGGELVLFPPRAVGDYAVKINGVYLRTRERLIFTGATDIVFHPGWFEAAVACLTPGIGVVGTNDLGSPRVMAGEHSTHSLVTREYADRYGTIDGPGKILHPGYWHEFCDDELVNTAKKRGSWRFAVKAAVEHRHPNWGKAEPDEMYAAQRDRMRRSLLEYRLRRRRWR
jgi:hypothetical protein